MKFLILNGGGIDSLCVAKIIKDQYPNIPTLSLYCNFGSPQRLKASKAAKLIANKYYNEHKELFLGEHKEGGTLSYANLLTANHRVVFPIIPNLNMQLFSVGQSLGIQQNCTHMISGVKHEIFNKGALINYDNILKNTRLYRGLKLEAPLFLTRFSLIYHIVKDDSLLHQTWSCNFDEECGECHKCKVRKEYGIVYKGGQ